MIYYVTIEEIISEKIKTEFDFEELECKGALRGNLKMLNESGVEATEWVHF